MSPLTNHPCVGKPDACQLKQLLSVLMLWLLVCSMAAKVEAQTPRKVALLIGVEHYEKRGFSDLSFAEDDMTELAQVLTQQGFEVTLLLGSAEGKTKANGKTINDTLGKSFIPTLKKLNKEDICLVAMAGHGRHGSVVAGGARVEDHFYCPCDAHDTDTSTWISISGLIKQVEAESGSERNLILIDACRDNPSRGRGVDGKGMSLGRDAVAVLFASSYNEQAYEPTELKHGIFTYYVLQALSGAAKNFDDEVTWDSMVDYVKGRVEKKSLELEKLQKIAGAQRPNSMGNLRGQSPVLARIDRKPPSPPGEMAASITNSLGMKLVLIPAGEGWMGSTESKEDLEKLGISLYEGFDNSDEFPQHRIKISQSFYMGIHEVTLGEFLQYYNADKTNHKTEGEKDGQGAWGYDGKEFAQNPKYTPWNAGWNQPSEKFMQHPVVNVSWNDAVGFCEWLTAKERQAGRIRNDQAYTLPSEAQWEYACRGGSQLSKLFSFGNDGQQMVSHGNVKGAEYATRFKNRYGEPIKGNDGYVFTSPVGSFQPNAFGLYDMHGNVWEWCQDVYDPEAYAGRGSLPVDPLVTTEGSYRVNRGGSWRYSPVVCRSAVRGKSTPDYRYLNLGFRVSLQSVR